MNDGSGDDSKARSPSAETVDARSVPAVVSSIPPGTAREPLYRDYELAGEQGRGGLGRVLRAHDRRLGRDVAVKELLAHDAEGVARFLREARLTARLQHPSIVPVYELGFRADGAPYYAMKLVEGERLDELVARARTLDERLALLPNLLAVAEAVAFAHEHKIIHRDLKPSNVLVGAFGETVVIDWGLAKDLADTGDPAASSRPSAEARAALAIAPSLPSDAIALDPTMPALGEGSSSDRTRTGHAMGTLAYMPPEQFRGDRVDARADVFALGACLYQLVTGRAPYAEGSIGEVSRRVERAEYAPLEEVEPGAPKELAAIARKAMAREPGDRYASAKELAADLRRFQTGQLVGAHHYSKRVLFWRWIALHKQAVLAAAAFAATLAVVGTVSVRRVVRERDRAEAQSARADAEKRIADDARAQAEGRALTLVLVEAKTSLDRDPTATLAWLKTYPTDGPQADLVPSLAADAVGRGAARHVLRGHAASVTRLAISTDGRIAVTAGDGKWVRAWDVATGRTLGAWRQVTGQLAMLDASRVVAVAVDGEVARIDVATGERVTLGRHRAQVDDVQVAPDGATFATCGEDGDLLLWPARDPKPAPMVLAHVEGAECDHVQWSSGTGALASVWTDHTLRVFDPRTRALTRTLPLGAGEIRPIVAFSPDGVHLAIVEPTPALRLVDLATGASTPLVGHAGAVQAIDFTRDGKTLVTGGRDGTVRLWDVATKTARVFYGHSAVVENFDVAPDGARLVTCSEDQTVRVWDLESGEARVLRGHTASVQSCAFTPDGATIVTGGSDATVRIWDARDPPQTVLRGHQHDVHVVAWTPDGAGVASGAQDGTIRVWDPRTGDARVLAGHTSSVTQLRFLDARGERLASASWDHTIRTWDLATGATLHVMSHDNQITGLAATKDGATLVSSSLDGSVRAWDAATGASRFAARSDSASNAVALSVDESTVASAHADGTVRLWDARTGDLRVLLRGHRDAATNLAFSPDGRLLASASWDGTIRLWDARTGALVRSLEGHTDRVRPLAWSDDGVRLVSGSNDGTARVWDVATGASRVLEGHAGYVRTVAFSPDGALVASGANDATTRVWDARTGRLRALFRAGGAVVSARFSPDGALLASGGWDAKVRIRAIDPASLVPADAAGTRAWLDGLTSAVVDARGELASPLDAGH